MKRVLFRPQAARDLERLPSRDRDQVEEAIERFAQTGSGDVKMLGSIPLRHATLAPRAFGQFDLQVHPCPSVAVTRATSK